MFQQGTEICLRCLSLLVAEGEGAVLQSREIGATMGISATYVTKSLQPMARQGWLRALKGRNGGWTLAVDPASIMLSQVIDALEPERQWNRCVIGHGLCSDETACAFHDTWGKLRRQIEADMQKTSVADLKNFTPPAVASLAAGPKG
ncbi:MAG: Rrf2 family transcriptional regulator [Planctomycetota bacterium]